MAKQQSLASQSQGTAVATIEGFDVATAFGEQGGMQVIPRMTLPYLVFAQPKAEEQFRTLVRAFPDIEDGDPVLMHPAPTPPEKIVPLRLTMVSAKQYYAERDITGKELQRSSKPQANWAERIFAALILYHNGKAIPCTCTFKTTKCAAAHQIDLALKECQKPEWMDKGPEYKQAVAVCPVPFCRIVAQIGVSGKVSRSGKGAGLSYRVTQATIQPSGPTEWAMLADLQKNNIDAFKNIAEAYKARITELNIKD